MFTPQAVEARCKDSYEFHDAWDLMDAIEVVDRGVDVWIATVMGTSDRPYNVTVAGDLVTTCSCPGWRMNKRRWCKHGAAVALAWSLSGGGVDVQAFTSATTFRRAVESLPIPFMPDVVAAAAAINPAVWALVLRRLPAQEAHKVLIEVASSDAQVQALVLEMAAANAREYQVEQERLAAAWAAHVQANPEVEIPLPPAPRRAKAQKLELGTPLVGHVVVVTGKLERAARGQGQKIVIALGGQSGDAVTPATTLLVVGADELDAEVASAKLQTARDLQAAGGAIEILSEADFWARLGVPA